MFEIIQQETVLILLQLEAIVPATFVVLVTAVALVAAVCAQVAAEEAVAEVVAEVAANTN